MSRVALSAFLALFAATVASAQETNPTATFPATPLASKHFAYPTGIVSVAPALRVSCTQHTTPDHEL